MKILIADDESIIRMGLKVLLQELGHEVVSARDGSEALQQARAHQIDLAILDINMPKTNGLQAARALARHRPLPIIFLTAYGQEELVDQATELPVHGYLIKPVQTAELNAAIHVAVKRFRDQEAALEKQRQLAEQLETRILLDRAKGKLIAAGLDETAAHRHIQTLARTSRRSVREIAQEIIDN